ncbi:K P-type ATPase (mediates high-affinity potassium or sodium uptake) [Fusarium beomiforme]|uniref:K P-type ATPase (Mediates high-affinity potassium or sodium uptake) n=1 Tax=Fusarium beomiforme TaxID=44412 RepID=A0A9P5DY73_9HYPO|nr:K P-type ATPase (mediates high-affinity potassium or sodium uptake) [Fusarium beomiforme]
MFSRLPNLHAFTLTVQDAHRNWHIDGFQQYRPQSRIRPGDQDVWLNFSSKNIFADTGKEWNRAEDHLSDPTDLPGTAMIGFYGYSRGNRSQGGKWPGFRYWTETKKLEFRPLIWWEIERYHHTHEWYDFPYADLIAKLWINRPGQPADAEQSEYGS